MLDKSDEAAPHRAASLHYARPARFRFRRLHRAHPDIAQNAQKIPTATLRTFGEDAVMSA